MKKIIEAIKKLFKDKFLDALKWVLDKPVKRLTTILLSLIGISVGATQMETVIKSVQTYVVDEKMRHQLEIVVEQNRKITDELLLAKSIGIYREEVFKKTLGEMRKSFNSDINRAIDSIGRLNKRIVALEQGSGTVTVDGGGVTHEGYFEDEWVDINIQPNQEMQSYDVGYFFTFKVGEIGITYEGEDGGRSEIYSVFLQSTKDTTKTIYVGDYVKQVTYEAKQLEPEIQEQKSSLNFDLAWSGYGAEPGISYSFWTTGNLRVPEVGVSSDFKESHNLSAGARYNIGSFIPLVQDLWLGLRYGRNFGKDKNNLVLVVGTTL